MTYGDFAELVANVSPDVLNRMKKNPDFAKVKQEAGLDVPKSTTERIDRSIEKSLYHGHVFKASKYCAERNQPEKDLQDQIIAYARLKGWHVAYFRAARVRRGGREVYETPVGADGKGFPDLVLIRERVVWIETKSDNGVLSEAQEQWWKWLLAAGQEYYVIRPSDWDRVAKILERGEVNDRQNSQDA